MLYVSASQSGEQLLEDSWGSIDQHSMLEGPGIWVPVSVESARRIDGIRVCQFIQKQNPLLRAADIGATLGRAPHVQGGNSHFS